MKIELASKEIVRVRALCLYLSTTREPLHTEVIYIGQSYGIEGSRNALHRLSKHKHLQEILTDLQFKGINKDIAIILWEFTPRLYTSFDGKTKQSLTNEVEDLRHLMKVMNDPPL